MYCSLSRFIYTPLYRKREHSVPFIGMLRCEPISRCSLLTYTVEVQGYRDVRCVCMCPSVYMCVLKVDVAVLLLLLLLQTISPNDAVYFAGLLMLILTNVLCWLRTTGSCPQSPYLPKEKWHKLTVCLRQLQFKWNYTDRAG